MSPMKSFFALFLLLSGSCALAAEHGPSPYVVPAGMVPGGAFIDRILPMPVYHGLVTNVWGGDNVKPRDADNGLEDPKWSYWCMSVQHGPDGREHMFAVRWPEDSPKGHKTWPNSRIVHAVAERPTGPFAVKQEIGPGHNVMCYQAKDGTYVLYAIGRAYTSKSLEGPWAAYDLQYDLRGGRKVAMSNHTFTRREDGSYLMVSRSGHIWISEDGLKPYKKITDESVYPPIQGAFEDPVVWRDEVQYNLIVNDWFGRTAYYLRSKDGVRWVWDAGKAYDTDVVRHPDGSKESWFKMERPNVRQDEHGRATHIYFAAIDCPKDQDLGGDNHSSKILALPLCVPRRLEILDAGPPAAGPREIRVSIKAEEGFDPAADVDVPSLSFGAPSRVDFGKGAKPLRSEVSGKDLVVVFEAAGGGFAPADYAGKLLGKNKRGELLLGYARLPGQGALQPILVARAPALAGPQSLAVTVENFGQVPSAPAAMKANFRIEGAAPRTATAAVPALPPYGSATVTVPVDAAWTTAGKAGRVEAVIESEGGPPIVLKADAAVLATGGRDGKEGGRKP